MLKHLGLINNAKYVNKMSTLTNMFYFTNWNIFVIRYSMKRKAKFKSEIKGLRIERSSYFLDRQFQGKRFRETIGRVNDISL